MLISELSYGSYYEYVILVSINIYIYKIFAGRTCSLQVIGETLEVVEATRTGEEKLGSTIINQVC